jgi:hypothetical protein
MSDRRPDASSITDDQLDALHDRIEELSAGCGQLSEAIHHLRERAEQAEAALARYRAAWQSARQRAAISGAAGDAAYQFLAEHHRVSTDDTSN